MPTKTWAPSRWAWSYIKQNMPYLSEHTLASEQDADDDTRWMCLTEYVGDGDLWGLEELS